MRLGKSKIFLLVCLSFILGVFLGKYLTLYVMAAAAMFFILLLAGFWARRPARLIGFLGLILLLGSVRYQTSFPYRAPNFIGRFYNQSVDLVGVVVRDPDVRETRTNLTIRVPAYAGNILVTVGRYPDYRYGDRLRLQGKVEEPFETEDFSYKNYLSRYNVYATMRFPEIDRLASGQGQPIVSGLLAVKHRFQEILSQLLPEPHNALLLGLLLGLKKSLPDTLKQALVIAGVSHIVVISGYNISIITRNLLKTRQVVGRKVAFWLSLLTVLAFVILTGAEASVIRAAVMGLLVVLALNLGRLYQPVHALVFVGAVMVAQNPKILNFDVGFQLSFLATLGLMYLTPMFEKWFAFLPDFLGFRTNLASTLAAQIFTLPLLIFQFDRISVVAPLVNVLILWVIPYAMFFGFFAGLVGLVFYPAAQMLGAAVWVLLEYLIRVVNFFAQLPLAALAAKINIATLVIYYICLLAGIAFYRYRRKFFYYLEYAKIQI